MRYFGAILTMVGMTGLLALLPAALSAQEPTVHGSRQADGLEVTLLASPPQSPEEMQRSMPGMGGMQGMQEMMRGMQGMQGMMRGMPGEAAPPTHWIGVVVRNVKEERVVPGLDVTLAVKKGELTRVVKLMPMPGSYGANISLPEKGRYSVTVNLVHAGRPVALAFEFDYR